MSALAQHVVAVAHLNDLRMPQHLTRVLPAHGAIEPTISVSSSTPLPSGQPELWRAATLCAAGGHHLLMSGEPGAGKTMAAGLIGELLPPPSEQDQLEAALIYDVVGQAFDASTCQR